MTLKCTHTERYTSGNCVECTRLRARKRQARIRRELYGYGLSEPTEEQMANRRKRGEERKLWE